MLRPAFSVLPSAQRALWPELRDVPCRFVLYGGTAIALYLGHRESVDFDFFSSQPLDRDGIGAALPWLSQGKVIQVEKDAYSVIVERDGTPVKLSFFGEITTGRVGQPIGTDDGVLRVASLDDLFGHKVKVILQRAEGKDYQDIAALLASGARLERGLAAASALFGRGFPVMESVKALTYHADINEPWRLDEAAKRRLLDAVQALPSSWPALPIASRDLSDGDGSKVRPE